MTSPVAMCVLQGLAMIYLNPLQMARSTVQMALATTAAAWCPAQMVMSLLQEAPQLVTMGSGRLASSLNANVSIDISREGRGRERNLRQKGFDCPSA